MDSVERVRFDQMLVELRKTGLQLTPTDVIVRKAWFQKGLDCVNRARCYVTESKESCDSGPKYWVTIERNGETITPHFYFIRGRAEYDVAEWEHLLNDGPKPDILDFDTDE